MKRSTGLPEQPTKTYPGRDLHHSDVGAGGHGLKLSSVGASGQERYGISVVIPALNEARNLPHLFARLPADLHEVILVDGYSVDNTVAVARRLRPDVRVVEQTRRGKGNALACGFAAATGDIIVTVDADGSADPGEIPRFVQTLLAGADFAKGTRFVKGGGSSDLTRLRRVGYYVLTAFFNACYGRSYSDLWYGFNAFWRRHVPVLGLDAASPLRSDGNGWQWGDGLEAETLIHARAARAGLAVHEVPSFEHARIHGVSNLNAIRDMIQVLHVIRTERRLHQLHIKALAHRDEARRRSLLAKISDRLPRQVTGIALKMAGRQRAYLREAWDSDLLNEDGVPLSLPRQLRHVAGYIPAAIRYRLDDLGAVLGRLLDVVLISRRRTYTAAGALFAIPVDMIFSHAGLYGLVTNAGQLAVFFAALCACVRELRKWRGVGPPEKKNRPR